MRFRFHNSSELPIGDHKYYLLDGLRNKKRNTLASQGKAEQLDNLKQADDLSDSVAVIDWFLH